MAVAAAIVLVLAAPARAASIFGVVTDAATGVGLADFEVCAYEAALPQSEAELGKRCTPAEAEPEVAGEYTLGGVPVGSYKVAFLPPAGSKYAAELYDDVQAWDEAEVLSVPTGTPVDAALEEATTPEDPGTKTPEGAGGGSAGSASPAPDPFALPVLSAVSKPASKPLRCRKGFKKKKVKGKLRCVRAHRLKHRTPRPR